MSFPLLATLAAPVIGASLIVVPPTPSVDFDPHSPLKERNSATLRSLDLEWDSGDVVAVSAEAPPEPEPEPEVVEVVAEDGTVTQQSVATASRGDFSGASGDHASILSGIANGSVPSQYLSQLSFAPGHYAYFGMAPYLEAMNQAYLADTGMNLGINNVYRSGYQGRSFHGWGLAVDFNNSNGSVLGWGDYQFDWLMNNAASYGFYLPFWAAPNANPEPWHWEFGSYYNSNSSNDCYSQCPANRAFWIKH